MCATNVLRFRKWLWKIIAPINIFSWIMLQERSWRALEYVTIWNGKHVVQCWSYFSACTIKRLKDGICSATCYEKMDTSTAGYIMFYIIQGTLCKEMDLLTCYLHKSALCSWGPLFIAVAPLQAAMAVLEWTPTQREFGWGRVVSVKGQLINTQEWWFVPGGFVRKKRAEDAPSLGWGTAWPVCYYWGLLKSAWQKERKKDSRITISLATQVIALETTCQQAWNTTML